MHSNKHCGGKCLKFSTLTPPPVSWFGNEVYELALYAAEELGAIALGDKPVWILENQGGNFLGRILIQGTRAAGKAGEDDAGWDNAKDVGTATGIADESLWVKDVGGWRCIQRIEPTTGIDGEAGSLLSSRPMVWMVGVCEEHRRRVEVLIEVME